MVEPEEKMKNFSKEECVHLIRISISKLICYPGNLLIKNWPEKFKWIYLFLKVSVVTELLI